MGTTTSRTLNAALMLVLLAILFIAVNVLSDVIFRSAKLDLTANRLFTVSEGTRNILQNLKEPIRLRFYYSREAGTSLMSVNAYAERVEDLLRDYAAIAGDKLELEIIYPEPFSTEEDDALALGLTGAPTQDGEIIYFGLVGTNRIDGKEVIPFFALERETYLEYDLTKLIANLATPERPVLGIVTNLPLDTGSGGLMEAMEGRSKPFLIYEQLRDTFKIEFLEQDFDRVPNIVDVLMIVHPKELTPQTEYAIDQFMMRGGRALLFVDPHSEVSLTAGPNGEPVRGYTESSNLPDLMEQWGVRMPDGVIIADRDRAQRVATGFDARRQLADYVIWLGLKSEDFAQNDLVTANIERLNLGTVGYLEPIEGAETSFEPLIMSTQNSMLMKVEDVKQMSEPDALLRAFEPDDERYVIAARLSGTISTAFPDGRPEEAAAEGEEAPEEPVGLGPHKATSDGPVNVIVFADSDIFDDRFWVQEQNLLGQRVAVPTADNAAFVVSAVENLMGSNDLISLRARDRSERPFTVVQELEREAEAQYLEKEERLQKQIEETEARLQELQAAAPEGDVLGAALLSEQQEAEIEQLRADLKAGRAALREVQRDLRSDIDALGAMLRFLNIGLMPILVALVALGVAWARYSRRKAQVARGGQGV